jgi:predicted RNA-binding protein
MKDPNIVLVKEKKNIVWIDILEDAEEARGELSNKCTLITYYFYLFIYAEE